MKRFLILVALLCLASPMSFGATQHLLVSDYDQYGTGMVCVTDAEYRAQFGNLIHASDFSADNTNRQSAVKLMKFFSDVDKDACYKIHDHGATGGGDFPIPDKGSSYIVVVVYEKAHASHVYWHIEDAAGVEQVIAVDPPKY
jgi:hypothetical protein